MISEPIDVKALENFRLFVKFKDGTEGVVDLSEISSKGVFKAWDKDVVFSNVYIDKETKAIAWDENLEIDVNNLYLKIIGKSFDEWKKENYYTG
jgi:predicted RNA-binding protein with RPS1 domain